MKSTILRILPVVLIIALALGACDSSTDDEGNSSNAAEISDEQVYNWSDEKEFKGSGDVYLELTNALGNYDRTKKVGSITSGKLTVDLTAITSIIDEYLTVFSPPISNDKITAKTITVSPATAKYTLANLVYKASSADTYRPLSYYEKTSTGSGNIEIYKIRFAIYADTEVTAKGKATTSSSGNPTYTEIWDENAKLDKNKWTTVYSKQTYNTVNGNTEYNYSTTDSDLISGELRWYVRDSGATSSNLIPGGW